MELRFPSQKSIEISFKVCVAGTTAQPQTVSIFLEKGDVGLSFAAKKEGDLWVALVDRPGMIFGDGPLQMQVHVVVNSRLFVPFKSTAEVFSEVVSVELPPEQSVVPQDEPTIPTVELPPEPEVTPPVELTLPLPVKPATESLLKKLEPAKAPAPKKVEEKVQPKVVARKVPKPAPKVVPKPEPVVLEAGSILKSIEPQIERKVERVVEAAKPAPQEKHAFELKRFKVVTI